MNFWQKAGLFILAVVVVYAISISFIPGVIIIGIAALAFSILAYIYTKGKDKNAPTETIELSKKLPIMIVTIAILFLLVGVICAIIYSNSIETTNVCSVCNGSGSIHTSSGGIDGCRACGQSGRGSAAKAYDEPKWIGAAIICFVASGFFFWCKRYIKKQSVADPKPSLNSKNKSNQANEKALRITASKANFVFEFGHFLGTGLNTKWIANKPDSNNNWCLRCCIQYNYQKEADRIFIYLTPLDNAGNAVDTSVKLSAKNDYKSGIGFTIWWDNLWQNKPVDRILVSKIEIKYNDGTDLTINV